MRFFVAALLLSGVCGAQTETGSLTGSVTDITGAVIPKTLATLRLAQPPNTQYTTKTDENGEFRFEAIASGVYGLRLDRAGFIPLLMTTIAIPANQQTRLPPIALEVAFTGCGDGNLPHFRYLPVASIPGSIVGTIHTTPRHPWRVP
jgi:hypothetical protein